MGGDEVEKIICAIARFNPIPTPHQPSGKQVRRSYDAMKRNLMPKRAILDQKWDAGVRSPVLLESEYSSAHFGPRFFLSA